MAKLTFIDLFCGCGGFTLGLIRAGFECKAAVDFNDAATATLRMNLPELKHVVNRDLTAFPPTELAKMIGRDTVDVIVGGPPCQGFSTARQVDGANHGSRLVSDPRRYLYREFLRHVAFFRPRLFVMENVLGIRTTAGGDYFTAVQSEARDLGFRVHGQVEDAWELGVPQKRRRQLIIGVRAEIADYFPRTMRLAPAAVPRTTLGAAIGDLPPLAAGEGEFESDYCLVRRRTHVRSAGSSAARYLSDVLDISRSKKLLNHQARPHNARDLRDFRRLREGESSASAMRERHVKFEFPYDKSSFSDRFTRQSRSKPCSTIVAHLSKDGLMFIHPTQNRSITPREAARIQSFPDWFRFPEARTHAFRLIGNAVPPLVGEAVGVTVREFLETNSAAPSRSRRALPRTGRSGSARSALEELGALERLSRRELRSLGTEAFLSGWWSLLDLFPCLHPLNALDHGSQVISVHDRKLPAIVAVRYCERFARSGWPVRLVDIGAEAWRRHETGGIGIDELYRVVAGSSEIRSALRSREVRHQVVSI